MVLTWISNWLLTNYRSGLLKITQSEFTSIIRDVQKTTTLYEGSNHNQWDRFKQALLARCVNDKTYTHMLSALCLHMVVYDRNDEGTRIGWNFLIRIKNTI